MSRGKRDMSKFAQFEKAGAGSASGGARKSATVSGRAKMFQSMAAKPVSPTITHVKRPDWQKVKGTPPAEAPTASGDFEPYDNELNLREIKDRNLPPGNWDIINIEMYLPEAIFKYHLGVSKATFAGWGRYKKDQAKKKAKIPVATKQENSWIRSASKTVDVRSDRAPETATKKKKEKKEEVARMQQQETLAAAEVKVKPSPKPTAENSKTKPEPKPKEAAEEKAKVNVEEPKQVETAAVAAAEVAPLAAVASKKEAAAVRPPAEVKSEPEPEPALVSAAIVKKTSQQQKQQQQQPGKSSATAGKMVVEKIPAELSSPSQPAKETTAAASPSIPPPQAQAQAQAREQEPQPVAKLKPQQAKAKAGDSSLAEQAEGDTFPLAKLRNLRSLPPGVGQHSRDNWLSAEDFAQVFGMSREQFNLLPRFKRNNLRKRNNLF